MPELIDALAQPVTGEAKTESLTETRFPCRQCGAELNFAIGNGNLQCGYCGHENPVAQGSGGIEELNLHRALRELQTSRRVKPETRIMSCPNCAAEFALDAHIHSGECPFCSTSVVTSTGDSSVIKPRALLPFKVTADEAREAYRDWLKRRWFAPSKLKEYARDDTPLNGVYIPYWTYDSDTVTHYSGLRGDVYYVTERVSVVRNGKRVMVRKQVPKIRWSKRRGRTGRHFDDVLVGATRTLPRKITDWLQPWDLDALVPYNEEYLAGFSSEIYQVDLDEGFNLAQQTMDKVIRDDVRHAIGGDQQRIEQLNTAHSETTFKHVLLPLWTAGFRFGDKTYRFVVNGRSGKVRGERPYSVVKIGLAIAAGLVAVAGVVFMMNLNVPQGSGQFSDGIRHQVPVNWGLERVRDV